MERVEVVTGGASAAYGSDAVSGVVNFILDTDFTGFKGSVQGGATSRGDNDSNKISLSFGTPVGDRGHLLLSGQRFTMDGIEGYDDRNWFQHWGTVMNPDPNGPDRLIRDNVRLTTYTYGGLITGGPLAGTQFLEGGTPAPFYEGEVAGGGVQSGGSGVDPNSEYYWLVPDQERESLFARYTHEFDNGLTAFVQGFMGQNESGSGSFPEPFSGPWALNIQQDNAFLAESIRNRMIEEGIESFPFERSTADLERDRYFSSSNETFSFTTGFDAEFGGIRYNAYYQYGRNEQHQDYGNGRVLRIDRLPRALDAVLDEASGRVVCRSTLSFPNDGCVPINLFGQGSPSQEAMEYIWADSYHDQTVEQHFAEFSAQADPFNTWAGQVSIAGGVSYREDSFEQTAGPVDLVALRTPPGEELGYKGQPPIYADSEDIFNRGNPNGGVLDPIIGDFDVREVFVESIVPLASGQAFAESLDMSLALRHAVYSGSGEVWAWKVGLDWQVNDDLRLRATSSRDVRAGTLAERFDRTGSGGQVESDPLYPDDAGYMVTLVSGGNPNVGPEEADTITYGFVYQPSWLDGLAMSVDYYDIQIEGAIDQLGTQQILNQCYAGATELCEQITRNPQTDRIDEVRDVFLNVAEARTRGVDLELSYSFPVTLFGGGENIALRGFATRVLEDSTTNFGAAKVDRAGETGGGFGGDTVPDWTAMLSATYTNGPLSVYLQERYISSGKYDATWTDGVEIEDNRVDSASYTSLHASYNTNLMGGEQEFYFHVANLLDKDPPLVARASNYTGTTHTNRALFDMLGRRYTLGFRFNY